jgi:hypothetical protein
LGIGPNPQSPIPNSLFNSFEILSKLYVKLTQYNIIIYIYF